MTAGMDPVQRELRDRLDTLEAGLRRSRVLTVLLVLAAAVAGVWVGRESATGERLRAQRFEVVDAEGRVRASLGVGSGESVALGLLDGEGRVRIVAGVGPDGSPRLRVVNEFGNPAWEPGP